MTIITGFIIVIKSRHNHSSDGNGIHETTFEHAGYQSSFIRVICRVNAPWLHVAWHGRRPGILALKTRTFGDAGAAGWAFGALSWTPACWPPCCVSCLVSTGQTPLTLRACPEASRQV
eukprot:scaffold649160_cov45-Prasinocladus_malaysianus.AAC.1